MSNSQSTRISGLSDIAADYRGILCDVWGVLHNGQSVYAEAAHALEQYRAGGGIVVMLTNSPRPNKGVHQQFHELGVSDDVFDAIVTSGDVTRTLIAQAEGPIFHLGPGRDIPLFDGLDVELTDEANCNAIVCTGLFEDEVDSPDDYRTRLQILADRHVPFICANPDIVVERGERLIWCAGSLARLYEEFGGETLVAGKPHRPIYELAQSKLAEITGEAVPKSDIIAIGDGMPTDVKGAQDNGLDLLYISAGIHSAEYGPSDDPDEAELLKFLATQGADPAVWMPHLVWQTGEAG